MLRIPAILVLVTTLTMLASCGKSAPPVYPVSGKVTLGGKAYKRLLVYFRPANGPVNEYNMAVGETDDQGTLAVQGNAGVGMPVGEYKVTFTCQVPKGNKSNAAKAGPDDKPSELGYETVELVPDSHAEGKANETSTVLFTVKKSGDNVFTYDIPSKK